MQKKHSSKFITIFCAGLIAAMVLLTAGCNGSTKDSSLDAQTENDMPDTWPDGSVVGEGSKEFTITVIDKEGNKTELEIHTDQETVGAALSEIGLIDGDEGEYGLYVKTVNGITADYDKDGMYWAFYINDEYAQTGVDVTNITEGDNYAFKIEKG